VTLTVIDDAGKTDSYSRIVKVKNLQPVAGFEMSKESDANWGVVNITISGAQTVSQTIWFRSQSPSGTCWDTIRTADNIDLPNGSTSTEPTNYTAGDKNLSYDPEGNGTEDGLSSAWGIISYTWHYGDGTPPETKTASDRGACAAFSHPYSLGASEDQKTFTVELEVMDNQSARNTLTRTITLNKT
jgi:hypothetical protein